MTDWFELLETHFNQRKKGFLIFDETHILRYLSGYAREFAGSGIADEFPGALGKTTLPV